MTLAQLFPMFLLAAFVGALVGCLVSIELTRRALATILAGHDKMLAVDKINMICEIRGQDGKILMNNRLTSEFQEMSAHAVQAWLDRRDLVMAPKGKDFKAKVHP